MNSFELDASERLAQQAEREAAGSTVLRIREEDAVRASRSTPTPVAWSRALHNSSRRVKSLWDKIS